jgi:hypothetical protein
MNTQLRPTVVLADAAKLPPPMKIRCHVYPDARSTSRMRFCSAWSRRYGRSDRAN